MLTEPVTTADEKQMVDAELTLLLVDDEPHLLELLDFIFSKLYTVRTAQSGMDAIRLLREGFQPKVIIADQRMPGMSGAEFLARSIEFAPDAVRVVLTGYTDVNDIVESINKGQVYRFLTKPWRNEELMQEIALCFRHYKISSQNRILAQILKAKNEELERANSELRESVMQAIRLMSDIISTHEHFYYNPHSQTVANIVQHLGRMLGLSADALRNLMLAALLHDIGKVGMPERILTADPETLQEEDRALYRSHVQKGVKRILAIRGMQNVAAIVLQHHEFYDGSGFPFGLMKGQISLEAQILSIADAYHNMVYKMTPDELRAIPGEGVKPDAAEFADRQGAAVRAILRKAYRYSPDVTKALYKVARLGQCEFVQLGTVEHNFEGMKIEQDLSELVSLNWRPIPKFEAERPHMPVHASKLEAGMELAQDLKSVFGSLLMPKGSKIDSAALEILNSFFENEILPDIVIVYQREH